MKSLYLEMGNDSKNQIESMFIFKSLKEGERSILKAFVLFSE